MRKGNLLIGIYFHPEAYPPTLNAIAELSEIYETVTVVHRNHRLSEWEYPANVRLLASGSLVSSEQQQQASLPQKITFFLRFAATFLRQCIRLKPRTILLYDSMSLYAYHLAKSGLIFKHQTWYHNHDVTEPGNLRKYSIGWLADKAEKKSFRYLDIFSLPADDRLIYFPMEKFKGQYFFIPNYPSKKFYTRYYQAQVPGQRLRVIFQGQVARFRGIEEFIPILNKTIKGHSLELGLIGPCEASYSAELIDLAKKENVEDKVVFDKVSYATLPSVTNTYHVGLGILASPEIMHATVGTASNKLYEYAALGLPVLYYNNPHFNQFLSRYRWAFPVNINGKTMEIALEKILEDYALYSTSAHDDFLNELNFENVFFAVKNYLELN